MNWTSRKPTEPGWYWYRDIDALEKGDTVVWVNTLNGKLKVMMIDGWSVELEKMMDSGYSGQWAGPLQPPAKEKP